MTKEKVFIATCVNGLNDEQFREYVAEDATLLAQLVDNSKEITKNTFLKNCFVEEEIKKAIKQYPHDYCYYKNKNIYFYTWSAIEHFYI